MIHYDPELHHEAIVLHIAHSFLTGLELDTPLQPMRNDGRPSNVVLITEEDTYSIPPSVFLQLELDGLTYAYHRAKFVISQYEQIESLFKQNTIIGIDTLKKHIDILHETDCCPKNIVNEQNPFYEEDPETSRQEAIRKAYVRAQVRNIPVNLSECETVTRDYMPPKETMHMDWS